MLVITKKMVTMVKMKVTGKNMKFTSPTTSSALGSLYLKKNLKYIINTITSSYLISHQIIMITIALIIRSKEASSNDYLAQPAVPS